MKVLVIRFSSIGDVVLTTPVLRALREQRPNVEIHFLTKRSFSSLLANNPNIDKLHCIERSVREVLLELKAEKFDRVIDLHNNIRTLELKLRLGVKAHSFPKLNLDKWLLVRFKNRKMPDVHVVDRYFQAVKQLGVVNQASNCELVIPVDQKVDIEKVFGLIPHSYVCIAIGAQFATKRMPMNKLKEVIELINFPIVLSGGPTDSELAEALVNAFPEKKIISAAGTFSLLQSADIVRQAKVLLTNDTGLMHIATCFSVPIVSVWGNTVPELGMYPYYPQNKTLYSIHEVKDLSCRPCSKIGFQACPKGHFNCMQQQDTEKIAADLRKHF
jgi:ADP-heptose:LPS heptosyltransferase